jgi:hypothetical protein
VLPLSSVNLKSCDHILCVFPGDDGAKYPAHKVINWEQFMLMIPGQCMGEKGASERSLFGNRLLNSSSSLVSLSGYTPKKKTSKSATSSPQKPSSGEKKRKTSDVVVEEKKDASTHAAFVAPATSVAELQSATKGKKSPAATTSTVPTSPSSANKENVPQAMNQPTAADADASLKPAKKAKRTVSTASSASDATSTAGDEQISASQQKRRGKASKSLLTPGAGEEAHEDKPATKSLRSRK